MYLSSVEAQRAPDARLMLRRGRPSCCWHPHHCALPNTTHRRGLKTALVEEVDFAAGASSRSTKLVHGGVRYLEKAVFKLDPRQLNLVTEALQERAFMLQSAPHLAKSLPILTPCYHWWEVPYYWAGLKVSSRRTLPTT